MEVALFTGMKKAIAILILAAGFYWWQHEPAVTTPPVSKLTPEQMRQSGREQQTLLDLSHNRR